jgi:hypothetical protein
MPREITIRPVLNGFVVDVGCQRVVFSTTKQLGIAVEEYYNHPDEVEAKYRENAVNKIMNEGTCAAPPPPSAMNIAGTDCAAQERDPRPAIGRR